MSLYKDFFKPFLDRFCAFVLLCLFSPILLICAILIRYKLGSPVFFRQERPGLNGKIFKIYKFRTMSDERDENGELLPDELRLKGLGLFIRKTSLDELPQLLNVLKGEMSFIGPRPLLVEYLPLYSQEEAKRHNVLPGITGLAQVNGRNAISWNQKFSLDLEYVEKISFSLDLQIFFLTIKKVLIREGITEEGKATMSKFTGSPKRVALYGAGGHAKVLKEIAELTGFDILCVIDKQKGKQLEKLESITEEEFLDYSKQHNIQNIILAIGNNTIREQIYERLNKNYHFPILIHPKAIISSSAHIQEGVVVCAGAIINSDAIIKRGAIINSGSIIEHDNCIDEFVHISPNATLAGNVHVGARSHIGAGSVIREGLSIGENCTIGAGAVVVKSILDNKKVVGNPANREL